MYVKWVYKLKLISNSEITKYKARLVAKGFLQRPRIDFNKVYASVAILETINIMVVITSYKWWKMHKLDVKSSFLN